ncbi:acyl-CoA N-acyltransferase [Jaminaea rosea]|uniref:Glucosamine 6-phosphate N-acetyltransferase n=1 Tax=Jaminaea rosea TaxID=1569628 RepID=A0A316V5N5_9BASI|nr:acyl-CoA N-acyltransferase [Jaminaea rosea]PWN30725.1 acyl-CoA N-acyltransferase [Jaminaea rosea]
MPFTADKDLKLAFTPNLIPAKVHSALPEDLHLRPLAQDDYSRGHLDVLRVLTSAPDVGSSAWSERFDLMASHPDHYYPIVIVSKSTDRVVALGTLFVEFKFLRGNAKAGHIEDIAVSKEAQGKGLGKRVIEALTGVSEGLGCYKTFLDCSEENKGFYERCGYEFKGVQMSKYAPSS